jgi:hypothetical protein
MEIYITDDVRDILIFLYLILDFVLTIFTYFRAKKCERWRIKIRPDLNKSSGLISVIIFTGIFSFIVVITFDMLYKIIAILFFIGFHIYFLTNLRRKCPFCQSNVKDYISICPNCKNNISSSTME